MEKKKTSIRIAQESRKKNNETGYFTGYITVLNGMSAFALAAAWGWGMSEIFRIEMDTKVILLGLLLISMLFSAGYGMSRVGGIGAGLGAAAAGIWYKWDICVGMGRRVFGQLRQGTAGDAEHLYQNIEMDTISVLVLMLPFLLVLIAILYEGKGRWAAAVFIILPFVCAGCVDEFPMTEMGVLLFNGGMYLLTGMIAADRTASGDITQMVQIRMELRRLIRGGIGLAVLLLVAFGSGKQLNVVKEEKDGWYMTARNTVRERLDEAIADAKERLTGQKTVRAKEESEKKKEAQKAAKSTAESQKAKSTDDTDPARLKRKLPVLETTGASGTTDKSGTANSILKDEIGNLNQITGFVPDDSVAKSVTITYRPESTVYVAERYGVFYEDDTWKDIEHSGKDDEEEMWEHMEDYLSCPTDLQKLTHYYIEEIQSQRLRQSEKRSAKLYGNLQSMIQNLVQHRQEKILWNIFFLKTGRASVSILHQQELYYSGLPEKRQDMRKDMQFRRVHLKNRKTELIRHRSAERWDMPGVRYGALMTDTGKMLK